MTFIFQGTGIFWRRGKHFTVNGSHAGQLVSSEFQTELREKTRKFEETMRDSLRLLSMVSHGKKTRGMDDLNQRQSPREQKEPRWPMRTLEFYLLLAFNKH